MCAQLIKLTYCVCRVTCPRIHMGEGGRRRGEERGDSSSASRDARGKHEVSMSAGLRRLCLLTPSSRDRGFATMHPSCFSRRRARVSPLLSSPSPSFSHVYRLSGHSTHTVERTCQLRLRADVCSRRITQPRAPTHCLLHCTAGEEVKGETGTCCRLRSPAAAILLRRRCLRPSIPSLQQLSHLT